MALTAPFVSNILGKDSNDYYEVSSLIQSDKTVPLLTAFNVAVKGTIVIKNLSYYGDLELTIKHSQGGCPIIRTISNDASNNTLIISLTDIGEISLKFLSESFGVYWGQFGYKLFLQESELVVTEI